MSIQKIKKSALILSLIGTAMYATITIADGLKFVRKNFDEGHNAEAIIAYERLSDDLKKNVDAQFIYATALANEGRIESATLIFEKLVSENPKIPEYYNNLAALYSKQNRFADAQATLEKGLATHKSYQTITENLRRLFQEQARISYAKALNVDNKPIQLTMLNEVERSTLPVVKMTPSETISKPVIIAKAEIKPEPVKVVKAEISPQPLASDNQISSSNPFDEAVDQLHRWAGYWSSQDVESYLTSYAKGFKSIRWPDRAVWKKERTRRVLKPKSIAITLTNIDVRRLSNGNYRVDFDMSYRSDTYKDKTRKSIEFIEESGKLKIYREVSLKAY